MVGGRRRVAPRVHRVRAGRAFDLTGALRALLLTAVAAAVLVCSGAGFARAATPQVPNPIQPRSGALSPLIPVPAGCPSPAAARVVFEAKLVANSGTAARFSLVMARYGDLKPYIKGRLIDVHYADETRFLHVGQTYVVGAAPSKGVLYSKVRAAAPLFGGDAVVGVNDTDTPCPTVEDSIRTLLPSGGPVDSGTFSGMTESRFSLLRALVGPLTIGLLVLLGAVIAKQLLFATGRGVRSAVIADAEAIRASGR